MKFALILIGLGFAVLAAEEQTLEDVHWTQYARGGLSHDLGINGGHAYYRINRKTLSTFQDLRLFGYSLSNDSYIYLRYKSSIKYNPSGRLYNFTTIAYQKNTRADLDLRYHFNQGFGYFINDYEQGLVHAEIGHAYDMSNYLNDTHKTSYLKSGLFWDHDMNKISLKVDAEWFKQISDVVDSDLSRFQFFAELTYRINKSLALIAGVEQDYYTETKQHPQSYYISLGWRK